MKAITYILGLLAITACLLSSPVKAEVTPPEVIAQCMNKALGLIPQFPDMPELPLGTGNKSHQCNPKSCNGNMNQAQCAASVASLIWCLSYQEIYSLCVSEHFATLDDSADWLMCIDDGHKQKMSEWLGGLKKNCFNKCIKRFPGLGKYAERIKATQKLVAKNMLKAARNIKALRPALRLCGKLVTRLAGPIGWAFLAGELGAATIHYASGKYVENMDRQEACKLAAAYKKQREEVCGQSTELYNQFTEMSGIPECKIEWNVTTDSCGPTNFSEIGLSDACNDIDFGCEGEEEEARIEELMGVYEQFAERHFSCMVRVRTHTLFQRVCDGRGYCNAWRDN